MIPRSCSLWKSHFSYVQKSYFEALSSLQPQWPFSENEEVFQLQVCQANEQLQAHHSLRQEGDPQDVPAVQIETKRALLG